VTERGFEQVEGRPAPALAPYIERYLGYRMAGFEPGIHVGMPGSSLTFIVSFDAPIDLVGMPDPAQSPAAIFGAIGGLAAGPAQIRHDGNQHGVALDVTALGARALFRMPASALAWAVVEPADVLGSDGAELVERLNLAAGWEERFSVIDEVLLRVLTEPAPAPAEVRRAWQRLRASEGSISVAELADEIGWSRRHLSQQFRAEFGITPKVTARIMRFERATQLLKRPGGCALVDVAAACGYSDQAHLTREWRSLAGTTPAAWLAAEQLPFVQDDEPVGGRS
jgi:AraC-like DNA-binding protein